MSFGLIVRHRRRLLMQLEKHKRSASSAVKRSLAQPNPSTSSSKLPCFADSPSVSFSRPFSLPDTPTSAPPVFKMPSSSRPYRAPPARSRPTRGNRGPKLPVHPGPMNDERRILEEYANPQTPLLAKHSDNPKSSVNNFAAQVLGGTPKYVSVQGTLDSGRTIWRQVDPLSLSFSSLIPA